MTRKEWRVATIILACALAPAPVAARAGLPASLPSEKSAWIRAQSAHFTFFSDAPEKQTRKIAADLERYRTVLSLFHSRFSVDPPRPTLIFVFKSDEDFLPYKTRVGGRPVPIGGFFLAHEYLNYVAVEAIWKQDASRIIFHEFLHQFIEGNLPNTPLWFNEGMAEYYSTFQATEGSAKVGLPLAGHVGFLAQNPVFPLRYLFLVDHDSPEYNEEDRMGTFYAESWALVHYLLNGNTKRRPQVGLFLDSLREGTPLDEAFRASFQTGYDDLLKEMQNYIAQGRFPHVTVKFAQGLRVNTSVKMTPMKREEVLSRLGDLLAHLGPDRAGEAEAHFREALRIDSQCALAEAGLGYLEAAQERFPQAAEHYATALGLDPPNYLYAYLCATSLLALLPGARRLGPLSGEAPEEQEKARKLLRKSIRLRPDFAEAYVSLGQTFLGTSEGVDEGITCLEKARGLLPSRMDVVANLVSLYLRKDDRERAGDLATKILDRSDDRRIAQWAGQQLEDYDSIHSPPVAEREPGEGQGGSPDFEKSKQGRIDFLEKQLKQATDPRARKVLEDQIRQIQESVDYEGQVKKFNQAVARANLGDHSGAIALLEKILPDIKDEELAGAAKELLARLKEDSKRFSMPSPW